MYPQSLGGKVPALELYDLESDPDEMTNLAAEPAHRPQLERLFVALRTWSSTTRDSAVPSPSNPGVHL